jgi:hypothetical protein
MKRLILFPVVALGLTACVTPTTTPPVGPVVSVVVGSLPEEVQSIAVRTCGYLPLAETVAALVAAFGGPAIPGIATAIAGEICGAVVKPQGRSTTRYVRGVQLKGVFVR